VAVGKPWSEYEIEGSRGQLAYSSFEVHFLPHSFIINVNGEILGESE
jgi:hypothetical protein